jgi:hypothetical protein
VHLKKDDREERHLADREGIDFETVKTSRLDLTPPLQ